MSIRLGLAPFICVALIVPCWAAGDQWKSIDRSMVDLVDEGYEVVTVIPSGRNYTYFLKSHAKLVKCREAATFDVSNIPPPPPPPQQRGAEPVTILAMPIPEMIVSVECFELARPEK